MSLNYRHCLAAFAVLLASPASARDVRVGVYNNPPKIRVDEDGAVSGFFADITEEIGRRSGWDIVYVPGTWSQCLHRLESGELDLMVDVAYSPGRAERFSFCQMPALSDWFMAYASPGVEVRSTSDMEGRRVAVLQMSIQHDLLQTMLREEGMDFTLVPCSTFYHVFGTVRSGDADIALCNRYFAVEHADTFGLVETPVVFHPTRLHFAAPPGERELLDAVDSQLVAMMADRDSEYFNALEKWFDGRGEEGVPEYIPWALGAAAALVALTLALYLVTRWQVRLRTRELDGKNRRLTRALAELGKARSLLARQESLRLLGTMVSGLAHDLNNILSVITGNVDLILEEEDLEPGSRLRERLESMRKVGRDGAELVARMRAFHSRESSECGDLVDTAVLVRFVARLLEPRLASARMEEEREIDLKTDLVEGAYLRGSPSELREMLLNLLVNAIDAIEGSGSIRVVTRKRDGRLLLRVSDDGAGMTPKVREECTQPFFTTKGGKGTGMGLAMVRSIVEEHGGGLSIESAPGAGTTVEVSLPLAAHEGATAPRREEPGVPQSARIMAVDDEPGCLEVLKSLLELDGHRVSAFSSPEEALASFEAGVYDAAILDRLMPGMTGLELARRLRELDPNLPIALLAGYISDFEVGREKPVDAVRQKSLALEELRALLVELL
ncbi:MAG: ATP-binding protein [Candidatus Fermentibacterota bacterium]